MLHLSDSLLICSFFSALLAFCRWQQLHEFILILDLGSNHIFVWTEPGTNSRLIAGEPGINVTLQKGCRRWV